MRVCSLLNIYTYSIAVEEVEQREKKEKKMEAALRPYLSFDQLNSGNFFFLD